MIWDAVERIGFCEGGDGMSVGWDVVHAHAYAHAYVHAYVHV